MTPVSNGALPVVVDNLEVNEVHDGLVIYDPAADRVHHLNSTASIVFSMCDGNNSAEAIATFMSKVFELEEPPLGRVEECLGSLSKQGLLK